MTTEELSKLTPEQKRQRIATLLGWSEHPSQGFTRQLWNSPEGRIHEGPPDYLNDLNAMAEVEKTLTIQQAVHYGARLRGYAVNSTQWDTAAPAFEWHATADQRATAFLLTLA